MSTLRLRPLQEGDEAPFVAAHETLAVESFSFGLGYEPGLEWCHYLAELEAVRVGEGLPEDLVPATFLVADIGGVIVGRTSVRHRLNEFLAREGGHIGYAVLTEFRCRGYATEILRKSLVIARSKGVHRVLITCDDVGGIDVARRWRNAGRPSVGRQLPEGASLSCGHRRGHGLRLADTTKADKQGADRRRQRSDCQRSNQRDPLKFDATGEPEGSAVFYTVAEGGKLVSKGLVP